MNEFDLKDRDDINTQLNLGHLLFSDRKCRTCGNVKNLVNSFYRTRKDRGAVSSSYSYECKECTIKRVVVSRITSSILDKWEYPDW
jgi:hypothetical protein